MSEARSFLRKSDSFYGLERIPLYARRFGCMWRCSVCRRWNHPDWDTCWAAPWLHGEGEAE